MFSESTLWLQRENKQTGNNLTWFCHFPVLAWQFVNQVEFPPTSLVHCFSRRNNVQTQLLLPLPSHNDLFVLSNRLLHRSGTNLRVSQAEIVLSLSFLKLCPCVWAHSAMFWRSWSEKPWFYVIQGRRSSARASRRPESASATALPFAS